MLTYEDCLGLCDLTEEEVIAIAEYEHVPDLIAVELGNYLAHTAEGIPMIKKIILSDLEQARNRGDQKKAIRLKLVLNHFVETHPERVAV